MSCSVGRMAGVGCADALRRVSAGVARRAGIITSVSRRPSALQAPGLEASGIAARTAGRRDVRLEDIVHDHAVGAEPPTKSPERLLHAGDPFAGQAVSIAVVE